jgi:membrane protein required for beta-lactamase induction
LSSNYFGLIEGVLVVGLAIAFYIWQMRTLNRDVKAREEREAREAAKAKERSASASGHAKGQHELDES